MDDKTTPRILSRPEHSLSRQAIDPDVLKILYRLQRSGFRAYLVGGCVRDLLLGKTPKDFDLATDAHPQQIRDLFRNCRLIGRRFRLAHIYFKGGKFIEVSTFRRRSEFDEESSEFRFPSDNTFGTAAEDAFRRDLTINGLFYNIADFSILDYVDGLEDLHRGIIRCIGDPDEKYVQDPVRMIRVIRHATRTGFRIEEKTYQSLILHVEKIRLCSPARVRDEFLRELKEGSARASLGLMLETGMLCALFPFYQEPLREETNRGYLLQIASALDALQASGNPLPDELCLPLFLLPASGYYCPPGEFPANRRGQAYYQQKVRKWVMEVLTPWQFTAHSKERAVHLLGTQKILREFLPLQKIPLQLARKPHFAQAIRLFEIGANARGEAIPGFIWQVEESKPWREKRKRRRRRRRKEPPKRGPEPGAISQESLS
ncbi:MAG: poly(A) polymerase [Deltaproteobacteria bacterium]|nr:poly(A) polymerase [Deltaproteobacteria bacterium]